MIDTKKEELNINRIVCEKEKTVFIEDDMIVPDTKPDILSAIDTYGNISIYKKEIIDEKIKIDGNINTYIMYIADSTEDRVRGINMNLDFSEWLDAPNSKSEMILEVITNVNNIECNVLNGRKINVKAEIMIKYRVFSNEKIDFINEITENDIIQTQRNEIKINNLVGYGTTKAYAKDTIMLDNTESLGEILKVSIDLTEKDVKTSYNKVLVKTDAIVKILYLTEDNNILSCENKMPIVGFVDIQNVSEDNICDTNFEIKNMIIKPNNSDEHSIYVEIELEISCMAYEEKLFNILQDLYSPIEELECKKTDYNTIINKESRVEKIHINETVNISEITGYKLIDVDSNVKSLETRLLNNTVKYEGEIGLVLIFENEDNQLNVQKINLPFEHIVDGIKNKENLEIKSFIEFGEHTFIVESNGDIVVDLNLTIIMRLSKNKKITIIENIEQNDNLIDDSYSLVMYIVKPGDSLWSIAKNLKSTVQDIKKANEIENEDLIRPGDKLYIPRFIKYA